jgi:GT2 family glycosyltransferase
VRFTWLSQNLLLVLRLPAAGNWKAVARTGRKRFSVDSHGVSFSRPGERPVGIALLRLSEHDRRSPPDAIVLTAESGEHTIDRAMLSKNEVALGQLIVEELEGGDAPSRSALQDLLIAHALPEIQGAGGLVLAARLRDLRDALRDSLPPLVASPESPQAGSVELIMAVDERSFWVVGWLRDADRSLGSLRLITPEGQPGDVLGDAYRHPRPDVQESFGGSPEEKSGFVTYLRLPLPSLLDTGWITVLERIDGSALELHTPSVVRDPGGVRTRILAEFAQDRPAREALRTDHAMPALSRLQDRHASMLAVDDIVRYGGPADTPSVSIVIPLYKRVDLLEHQLAHFAADSALSDAEIVYVLDSPELAPELKAVAPELHALYGLPFTTIVLNRNAGFSGANNIGVAHSHAPLLLLLNSDVIPINKGWVRQMAAFYSSTPDIGALGPKLVFEDMTLQHAGMNFKRDIHSSLWSNLHYFKGLHRDLALACVSRPVPAVTGACLMVSRDLYQEMGGFRYGYVQGGYEDSDFCIRLAERGRRNWYLAQVELFHLEAQSFPTPERQLATTFNMWLQTYLWGDAIEVMMNEQEAADAALDRGHAQAGRSFSTV